MIPEEFLAKLDADGRASRDRVRNLLLDSGRPDLASWLDQKLRDVDLGLEGARATWHSISAAQRRVLLDMNEGRQANARIATLRNLERRDLVAWDGGAFTPEARAVLTEHGRFVIKHGRLMERREV